MLSKLFFKKIIFVILLGGISILLFFAADSTSTLRSSVLSSTPSEDSFTDRTAQLLSIYDTLQAPDYYGCAVKYVRGHDIDRANRNALALLREPRGDVFWMISVMTMYSHGKDAMSQEVCDAVCHAWKTYAPFRGDTENHWLLYYAALFLAAETLPHLDGSQWFNGKSSEENLHEAKEYLLEWVRITTTIGQGEFDSPTYLPTYIGALILLHDFAKDPVLKKMGSMMCDYLLADFAVEHLNGQYIGGHSRTKEPSVFEPLNAESAGIAALYFGARAKSKTQNDIICALSSYRIPDIIYHIATDRTTPYIHQEKKRTRDIIRFSKEKNLPVYKYSYVTRGYALGSLQGGILQPIQQHTWGLNFISANKQTVIFGLHPYWSEIELGMFFPDELKTMIATVVASKGSYNNLNKWTGSSPFERTMQYRNTLLVLYDIPPGTTTEHIDGYFPKSLDTCFIDNTGWIISEAGETYIGWYPLQPYEWIDEGDHFRMRSRELRNGYVIEVRSQYEIGSFENFRRLLATHTPVANLTAHEVSVNYTTVNGDRLRFVYDAFREVNGKKIDLKGYKLFEGPFLNAEVGSKKLVITYRNKKRVLDFTNWSVTEQ